MNNGKDFINYTKKQFESEVIMKFDSKKLIVALGLLANIMILSNCETEDCPYTDIDCAECCKAGRFVSDECCRKCNRCYPWNTEACAECNDYPH